MRPVICALITVLCVFPVLSGADLTVVLDFETKHSARSVAEMKAEAERLLTASGVSVDWRPFDGFVRGEAFPKLAVVKFKGQCELTPIVTPAPEDGAPLGFTYETDGSISPFSEVECDRVRGTLGEGRLESRREPARRDLRQGAGSCARARTHTHFERQPGACQARRDAKVPVSRRACWRRPVAARRPVGALSALEDEGNRATARPFHVGYHGAICGQAIAFNSGEARLRRSDFQHAAIPAGLALKILA